MNTTLKRIGERALVASGVPRLARLRVRSRLLVLAYHNVVPDGTLLSGDCSLHLKQREFARQLDVLVQTHEVIPIHSLSEPPKSSGRPHVIVTLDDAYSGALTAGVDELVQRGIPATIFVAPALLGSVPWWDILADRTRGVVPQTLRQYALEPLGGRTAKVLGWMESQMPESGDRSALPRIGSEMQLRAAAARPGITLGSHTWSHPNLRALKNEELERELTQPLEWLRSRFSGIASWLSYPYGYFNQDVQNTAAGVGYVGSFRVDGGWTPAAGSPPHAIPRLNIPSGLSLDGFRLRLAGLL